MCSKEVWGFWFFVFYYVYKLVFYLSNYFGNSKWLQLKDTAASEFYVFPHGLVTFFKGQNNRNSRFLNAAKEKLKTPAPIIAGSRLCSPESGLSHGHASSTQPRLACGSRNPCPASWLVALGLRGHTSAGPRLRALGSPVSWLAADRGTGGLDGTPEGNLRCASGPSFGILPPFPGLGETSTGGGRKDGAGDPGPTVSSTERTGESRPFLRPCGWASPAFQGPTGWGWGPGTTGRARRNQTSVRPLRSVCLAWADASAPPDRSFAGNAQAPRDGCMAFDHSPSLVLRPSFLLVYKHWG